MTIVNKNRATHGQKLNLPDVGVTNIGADGSVDLPDEVAQLLLEHGGSDWIDPNASKELVAALSDEENEEDPAETGDNRQPKEGDVLTDEQKAKELEDLLTAVDAMTVEELLGVAEASKIKGYHLFKAKPDVLRNYIKNKLKAQ